MEPRTGTFVVSLDFELQWGLPRDEALIRRYRGNLLGVRKVVPALLELFDKYGIHATWATVGLLFFESRAELLRGLPAQKPNYARPRLSPYPTIEQVGEDEQSDPFHYAPSLIRMIASYPGQEIGTHTFCHYFCLEEGQDARTFRADLEAAVRAAERFDVRIESIVFPRNQCNGDYLSVCREMGLVAYRGTPPDWVHRAASDDEETRLRRGVRLIDAYLPISSSNAYSMDAVNAGADAPSLDAGADASPVNVPSSRFLRPYSWRLRFLDPLRLRRITADMTHAAREARVYHLYWHPHNFGSAVAENLAFLRRILDRYAQLRDGYGMRSLNMGELARSWKGATPAAALAS